MIQKKNLFILGKALTSSSVKAKVIKSNYENNIYNWDKSRFWQVKTSN